METLLPFVRGPLFIATFLFMALGLARLVVIELLEMAGAWTRMRDKNIPWSQNLKAFVAWLFPVRFLPRIRPVMSFISFLFHVGLILVPVFLAEHVRLWERGIGFAWPSVGRGLADFLTLLTMTTCLALLGMRILHAPTRAISGFSDYALLIVIFIPFASGYAMVHPQWLFLDWNVMMLIHVLSAELVFVLMPFTKLSHVVLFPFNRVSSDFFWRFPADGPDRVAAAVHGGKVKAKTELAG
jgi:nitrate reductase gamma subunit